MKPIHNLRPRRARASPSPGSPPALQRDPQAAEHQQIDRHTHPQHEPPKPLDAFGLLGHRRADGLHARDAAGEREDGQQHEHSLHFAGSVVSGCSGMRVGGGVPFMPSRRLGAADLGTLPESDRT